MKNYYLSLILCLLASVISGQTAVNAPSGTVVSVNPASGTALGNPGGKTISYSNANWPADSCIVFAFEKTLNDVINGYNTAPPGGSCSNMADLTLAPASSELANGKLVYTGATAYRYITTGGYYTTQVLMVRLTIEVSDNSNNPLALTEINNRLLFRCDADFNVDALLETYSPSGANYISGGANQWTPAITLFDNLHTDPNSSICTSLNAGDFYHFALDINPANSGPYLEGDSIKLFSNANFDPAVNVSWQWTGPNGFSSSAADTAFGPATLAQAGTYYLSMSNDLGCSVYDSTEVIVSPANLPGDTVLIVSDTSWRKSTYTTNNTADQYPWRGVAALLPSPASFSLPVTTGQPYGWTTMDTLGGSEIIKGGPGINFFRKTFNLDVDSNIHLRIRSLMDDGIELYLNGHLLAREEQRTPANYTNAKHELIFFSNGTHENGANGGDSFDFVNNYHLDSIVQQGENVITVVLRNSSQNDQGGFNLSFDIKSNQPVIPELTDFMVSDINWRQSTVVNATPSWVPNWSGPGSLPASSSFIIPVELGQVHSYEYIQRVPGSYPIKADDNIRYFRGTFELIDSAGIDASISSTFGTMAEFYLNGHLLARENRIAKENMQLPAHSLNFPSGGNAVNAYMGGDDFSYYEAGSLDSILKEGENEVVVVLRNRPSMKGGFSFRLDLNKGGNPVIIKKQTGQNNQESSGEGLQMALFPNPNSGRFTLKVTQLPLEAPALLEVIDLQGRVLHSYNFHALSAGELLDINLAGHAGVFLLRLRVEGELVVKKVLIQ